MSTRPLKSALSELGHYYPKLNDRKSDDVPEPLRVQKLNQVGLVGGKALPGRLELLPSVLAVVTGPIRLEGTIAEIRYSSRARS